MMHKRNTTAWSEGSGLLQQPSARRGAAAWQCTAWLIAIAALLTTSLAGAAQAAPDAQAEREAQATAEAHPSRAYWLDIKNAPSSLSVRGTQPALQARKMRTATLDRVSMKSMAAGAPRELTQAARMSPLVISLPHPDGGFQRFAIAESPVMEPGLAAKHPEIQTYAGRGLDDKTATLRMDITPLGLHASVRASSGAWYIDPYYHLDDSLYASYFARDLINVHGALSESTLTEPQLAVTRGFYRAADLVEVRGVGFAPNTQVVITVQNPMLDASPRQTLYAVANDEGAVVATFKADPYRTRGTYQVTASAGRSSASSTYQVVGESEALNAQVGQQLRTYRLALLTDPSYATYFGGSANVTAAKVTLINRVSQIYESETSIRLVLIAANDALNLDTPAQMTGANGPCGGTACYTPTEAANCSGSTLTRTRQVIGLLVGARNFDVGHIGLGVDGGGVASLGVVGGGSKAQGCTGISTPVGDFFAVDYVAHEMGHQFAGNHTFNGTIANCSTSNRNAGTSVEPGSGSSIMAYAGICGTDDLQSHSDPYWSQRSFDEIVAYTSSADTRINEVQMGALTGFATNGQQFRLRYNGVDSAPIVRGTNFTTAGVKAAIEGIAGWPAGATVTVSALGDTAFTLTFGGALAGTNANELALANCTGGCTGYIGEIAKGGTTTRGGTVSATANTAPVVGMLQSYTIPVRTPFALTGSATDVDNDTMTYLWEQNDRGATGTSNGTGLISNTKLNGPLFRQFGKRAVVSSSDAIVYNSPGENHTTTDPTRVFPDLLQVIANNTNAETGACPTASATPTSAQIDCFSEYLPTAAYVGTAGVNASPASLNFRFTARDGRGGVSSGDTRLVLAAGAGPFLVTAPNTAVTYGAGSTQTVTWSVAGTNAAPVSTANVKISLSSDGGKTYPYVLAASTPNTGSKVVTIPSVATTTARVKVEAVGNVFFDISNANFTIKAATTAP